MSYCWLSREQIPESQHQFDSSDCFLRATHHRYLPRGAFAEHHEMGSSSECPVPKTCRLMRSGWILDYWDLHSREFHNMESNQHECRWSYQKVCGSGFGFCVLVLGICDRPAGLSSVDCTSIQAWSIFLLRHLCSCGACPYHLVLLGPMGKQTSRSVGDRVQDQPRSSCD